tara:strand:+ start:174 stop:344 length:171 start_codon:yes stop_codon:yes gene_type:complete
MTKAPDDVQGFLKTSLKEILESTKLQEAIRGFLFYEGQVERFDIILKKIGHVINQP